MLTLAEFKEKIAPLVARHVEKKIKEFRQKEFQKLKRRGNITHLEGAFKSVDRFEEVKSDDDVSVAIRDVSMRSIEGPVDASSAPGVYRELNKALKDVTHGRYMLEKFGRYQFSFPTRKRFKHAWVMVEQSGGLSAMDDILAKGKIRVGTTNWPRLLGLVEDSTGKIIGTGLYARLMDALARALELEKGLEKGALEVEYVPLLVDEAHTGFHGRDVHLMAAMMCTPQRRVTANVEWAGFVHLASILCIAWKKVKPFKLFELRQGDFGAMEGEAAYDLSKELFGRVPSKHLGGAQNAKDILKISKITVTNSVIYSSYLEDAESNGGAEASSVRFALGIFPIGFTVKKEDAELKKFLDDHVLKACEDGAYQEEEKAYFELLKQQGLEGTVQSFGREAPVK